ncbi:hypothetical protein B484DRAFT_408316 [Ochromonadaceae sp. CCMP2298]|nr:hypothetical protein B484DRAFT_408316 [Ochromonadaceae sp. CCMP2298]
MSFTFAVSPSQILKLAISKNWPRVSPWTWNSSGMQGGEWMDRGQHIGSFSEQSIPMGDVMI